ncbi:MAG TPA: putative Ig domain-containing protein [Terriglobales bacterium]|nr:putative Ig domain-containing protein [Terriglobales bacterium]
MLLVCIGCGGGGGSSQVNQGGGGSTAAALSISDNLILPGTLQNHAYSVTLHAVNAEGAVTWSIAPISSTALFVNGLSIDPSTGVLSGTANFAGTAGFVATATDSASHKATKIFTITAYGPLQAPPPQTFTFGQFGNALTALQVNGGVQPLTFTVTGGSLPFGIKLNNETGNFFGSAQTVGTFPSTVTIQDSFSPPEIVTAQVSIHVVPPTLSVANSLPGNLLLNRPFSGRVVATGGIPPYHFSLLSGLLPPGLTGPDPSGGQISGTPTALGAGFGFTVGITDSSPTPQSAQNSFVIAVTKPLGRNDTVATATPIGNGQIIASISPYIDPPNAAPLAGDNDFYKLVSISGATVHVETAAANPLDTVIEIVDGNGLRQNTCRQPGDTSTTFASSCINDDISAVPVNTNSALDYQVPGAPSTPTTFYVHVLDWRGDARPDMTYALRVRGAVSPMAIATIALKPAARGLSYSQQLTATNATGIVSWTVSGSLPPGLTLSSSGAITGTATTDGIYSFSIQANDSSNPPQTVSAPETIQVVDPVKIISPPIFPDACVNTPYSFAIQTAGGIAPLGFGFFSSRWVAINLDTTTGVFSGSTTVTGTFSGGLTVSDATGHFASQQVTLTVKQCP